MAFDVDAMQIFLPFEKAKGICDAIEPDIGSTIGLEVILFARTGFESYPGLFIAAITAIT